MKIGDLVKVKRSSFHSWNGIIIRWGPAGTGRREVFVLQHKRGLKNRTIPFDPFVMEIVE